MNFADSMRSQDNINKVGHMKEKIKEIGENIIYSLWIEWQIFLFVYKINKLPENKQKIRKAKRMFILPQGTWKDNIRSVILVKRKRSSSRSNEEERSDCLLSERRDPLVTQADLSAPRVCSPATAILHKKGPGHRRKICANSLRLYSYIHTIVAVEE